MQSQSRRWRRWRSRLAPRRREVVLAAQIEYAQTGDQQGMSIRADQKSNDLPLPHLRDEVERVIEHRLPSDLEELFGVEAEIRVRACRYGSLSVFFSVLLTGAGLIASYKDFYDSIQLIREHCALLLRELLQDRYPHRRFDVKVDLKHPHLSNPYDGYMPQRYWKMRGPELTEALWPLGEPPAALHRTSRDGFFWFLLVLCTLLLGALGVLVYAAVVQTYFP
jgi:hypothetical protein